MTRIAPCILILLALATGAAAAVQASLPFGGLYRLGRYMPVVIRFDAQDATGPIELRAAGAIPVTIAPRSSAGELIIPLLVLAPLSDLRIITSSGEIPIDAPLRQAGADDYLVGFTPGLIPAGAILGIEIHNLPAVATIPVAWELFDELRIERLDLLDEQTIACMLAAGTIITDASGKTLMCDPAGPSGALAGESAYLPVAGDGGGLRAALRRQIVLASAIFAILATGCAMLRPAGRSLAAIVALVVVTSLGIALWRRAIPRIGHSTGTVFVEHGADMLQRDRWSFVAARDSVRVDMPLLDTLRPMLLGAAHAQAIDLTLHVVNGPGAPVFRVRMNQGMSISFMSRTVRTDGVAPATIDGQVTSPLLPLVWAMYTPSGVRFVGQTAPRQWDDWPGVVLRRN